MKKAFHIVIGIIVAMVAVGSIIMIFTSESKTVLRDIMPTDAAKNAYASGGGILTHDTKQELSFDGYMRCYSLIFIPEEKELQITVKSNNSVYEKLGTTAERGFVFKLYDVDAKTEFTEYSEQRAAQGRYGYYRLAFRGVEFSDKADIELIMLCPDDEERGSVIKLHEAGQMFEEYELSKEEIAQLAGQN